MKDSDALVWLSTGLAALDARAAKWRRRQAYVDGEQDLPFAPDGVSQEYLALREQAPANMLRLVRDAPVQRLSATGIVTGRGDDVDARIWSYWQANKLDTRQDVVANEVITHNRGVMSVWPTVQDGRVVRGRPIIRPESSLNVHIEPDPDDAFGTLFVVKRWRVNRPDPKTAGLSQLGFVTRTPQVECAVVYDSDSFQRFERPTMAAPVGGVAAAGWSSRGGWSKVAEGTHPMGRPPFVAYDDGPLDVDTGQPKWHRSWIAQLMPGQDAFNTARFFVLLSLQFSGFRQRIISGYDAVLRDEQGKPVYRVGSDGTPVIDPETGQPVPVIVAPGRFGVDRAITFNSPDTKVFDLQESDLSKQVEVLRMLVDDIFVRGQVPPQYALDKMANANGAGMDGAEGIYQSRIGSLQRTLGEADEEVLRLAAIAAGDGIDVPQDSEISWAETHQRAFQEVTDGVQKLAVAGLPPEGWFPMVPGATAQRVSRWLTAAAAAKTAAAEPVKELAASIRARASAAAADQ